MTFKVYQNQTSQWCWCLETLPDQKIAICSKCYGSRYECLHAIALVQHSENATVEIDQT